MKEHTCMFVCEYKTEEYLLTLLKNDPLKKLHGTHLVCFFTTNLI